MYERTRKVAQIDPKTKKVVNKFNSLAEAAKQFKAANPRINIISCCQGKQHTAYGYSWKYLN